MNTHSQAQPLRGGCGSLPEETLLLNCLKPLTLSPPLPVSHNMTRAWDPVSRRSQAAWVLRQRPLIHWCFFFQSKMRGQWSARQVQILVEQLSYGKIFGPGRAGISPLKLHAPIHSVPSFLGGGGRGCVCEYMDGTENCTIGFELTFLRMQWK